MHKLLMMCIVSIPAVSSTTQTKSSKSINADKNQNGQTQQTEFSSCTTSTHALDSILLMYYIMHEAVSIFYLHMYVTHAQFFSCVYTMNEVVSIYIASTVCIYTYM